MSSTRRTVTNERLANLWLAAMEGSQITKDDVLDVIDEVCRLREVANLPPPPIPTPANCGSEVLSASPLPI